MTTAMELIELPIGRIKPDPNNDRQQLGDLLGLGASIRQLGLIEPIVVSPDEENTYRIISGCRRYHAARNAGQETVPVVVRYPRNHWEWMVQRLVSNIQREDLNPIELAEAVQRLRGGLMEHGGQKRLALMLGKDETWVSRVLKICSLRGELKKRIREAPFRVSGDAVLHIARVRSQETQEALVNKLLAGASTVEIREEIRGLPRGFAAFSPERRHDVAVSGYKSAHAQGKTHQWNSEEAAVAGKKGGLTKTRFEFDVRDGKIIILSWVEIDKTKAIRMLKKAIDLLEHS